MVLPLQPARYVFLVFTRYRLCKLRQFGSRTVRRVAAKRHLHMTLNNQGVFFYPAVFIYAYFQAALADTISFFLWRSPSL